MAKGLKEKYGIDEFINRITFSYPEATELLELFLKNGASPEGDLDSNMSPLTSACWKESVDMVALLVNYGANPFHKRYALLLAESVLTPQKMLSGKKQDSEKIQAMIKFLPKKPKLQDVYPLTIM